MHLKHFWRVFEAISLSLSVALIVVCVRAHLMLYNIIRCNAENEALKCC